MAVAVVIGAGAPAAVAAARGSSGATHTKHRGAGTCTGVTLDGGASIQAAVDANPGGTRFCIHGMHAITKAIVPKSGDVFRGDPSATVDGGNVATIAFDGDGGTITDVTVRRLVVEHFNNAPQVPAVGRNAGTGWVIRGNEVAFNETEGIQVGPGALVAWNHVHDNGQLGISGYQSDDAVVKNNEVDHNNTDGYDQTWEAGGMKFYEGTNVLVTDNDVHDNTGTGIWFDTDVTGTISDNVSTDNARDGINAEITCDVTIIGNTMTGSGRAGVFLSTSHDVTVTDNTISGSPQGIKVWMDSTRTTGSICGKPSVDRDTATGNDVWLASGDSITSGLYVYHGGAPTGVVFSGNTYHASDCSAAHWQWYTGGTPNYTFTSWQQMGNDKSGTCGP
jgi:parallel beta-helix repeat protein